MIYHQAEQVSQQGSLIGLAHNRNESSARCVCSTRVSLSCWQDESVTSESTGWQVKMICSEMFVFCSSRFFLLTRRLCHQRARPSEIRSLNVDQVTSTRLQLGSTQTGISIRLTIGMSHQRDTRALLGSICPAGKTFMSPASSTLSQSGLTREFTLLENCMIYHQAEQVSQCDWAAMVKGVPHPLIGRLCTLIDLPAAWRQVSTSENHRASRSREIRRIESRTIE